MPRGVCFIPEQIKAGCQRRHISEIEQRILIVVPDTDALYDEQCANRPHRLREHDAEKHDEVVCAVDKPGFRIRPGNALEKAVRHEVIEPDAARVGDEICHRIVDAQLIDQTVPRGHIAVNGDHHNEQGHEMDEFGAAEPVLACDVTQSRRAGDF